MKKKNKELLNTIKDKFNLSISFIKTKHNVKLPPIIKMDYEIFTIKIEFIDFVLITPKHQESESIKRINIIQEKYNLPLLYLSENIILPLQQQFLKSRISFISEQMIYLYPLLLLKKEKGEIINKRKSIPISIQPLILYILYNYKYYEYFDIETIQSELDYSTPSLYRHIKDLEDLSLISVKKDGRTKHFQLNKKISFKDMIKLLHSPIKETIFIKDEDFQHINKNQIYCIAGKSALNQYNLAVSEQCYAVFYKDTQETAWDKLNYSSRYYDEYDEIQKWYYDPKSIIRMMKDVHTYNQNNVDPISLYLSLRNSSDDIRVGDAIEMLFENIERIYGWQTI
ncbi:winged helix-turn-helix domain-containing protein [Sulfurimonas indica]|uniref:winged helix-turn-helix domain-containing protein n=1 Tax=Sulfurimonas indica TaxID=2508707 RepID=UPI0012641534|nr:winged helix-turn-helix domain-containing protein [Sulfurimonas indica]